MNKKWYSFARIVKVTIPGFDINDSPSVSYLTQVTDAGNMGDWNDNDNYFDEEFFRSYEEAKADLLNQGYKWDSGIRKFVIILSEQPEIDPADIINRARQAKIAAEDRLKLLNIFKSETN